MLAARAAGSSHLAAVILCNCKSLTRLTPVLSPLFASSELLAATLTNSSMIQSKYKTLFYIPLVAICIALTFFILTVTEFFVDYLSVPNENKPILIGLSIFEVFWFLILFFELSRNAKIIRVNTFSKTISLTNYFTRKTQTFSYKDFDGQFDTVIKHGRSRRLYDAFGLTKDKSVIYRIDSYYYSNYEELKDGLSEIKGLGYLEFSFIENIKIFLRHPVIT